MKRFLSRITNYLFSKVFVEPKFIYLSLDAENFKHSLNKTDTNSKVFVANSYHKESIEEDLFPHFDNQQDYFKQFLNFDREDILCYLCKKNHKLVHYFLVFKNARTSPLLKTRFKKKLDSYDQTAYLGNAFTISSERGGWIVLKVLSRIVQDLSDLHGISKFIVLVHPDTPGALKFYQRLGFKIIN